MAGNKRYGKRPTKIRSRRAHSESDEQQAYFQWLKIFNSEIYELTTANAAGGKRSAFEAARLKREGLKKSYPDIVCCWPVKYYHGLFIELKTKKGRPTAGQLHMIKLLNSVGYSAHIAYGWEEAKRITEEYLGFIPL